MRVAIVEDEGVVAQRLDRLVRQAVGERLESLALLPTLEAAREHLDAHPIDVLLLDLNLDGSDGFALLEEAMAGAFATIVVSAQHNQALRAFELGVTDFVAKPFTAERLAQALGRVREREPELRRQARRLAIRKVGGISLVDVDRVLFVRGADDYSALHVDDGTTPLHHKSLAALECILPPRFARIHRSYLVDLDRVRELRSHGGGRYRVTLEDGTELPVSRTRVGELRKRFA